VLRPHPDPPLRDGAVVLRPLREDDVPAIVEACQDPLVKRFTASIPDPFTEQDARDFLASQPQLAAEGLEIHFTVADAGSDALLGLVGLHGVDPRHRRAGAGYWTAPWARGRGVATRALGLVARWALDDLGAVRVELFADVGNAASLRVAERAGFVREGTLRRYLVLQGAPRDAAVFGLVD
jgi:RimJ/RimL family protein N-acetyltransferase